MAGLLGVIVGVVVAAVRRLLLAIMIHPYKLETSVFIFKNRFAGFTYCQKLKAQILVVYLVDR